jgi:ferredoxin-NADP reductase
VQSGSLSSLNSSFPVIHGRPDMMPKIHEIVNNTKRSDSTIVAGCGPEGLMLEVRQAVAEVVSTGERNVTLHCEQFGW